jgi:N-acetylmuramoyl-L-alanine amidase
MLGARHAVDALGVSAVFITRRLLLGAGVGAQFLLPSGIALAAQAHRSSQRATGGPKPQTGKPAVKPVVMLDPGHGGKDPGAIGYTGTYEKQVALATAMELKHLLEASGHYQVHLTRSRDVFIPLHGRVDIAHTARASLFVSMHADALRSAQVRGASVYTLSDTASDAQTADLAQRENQADRRGGAGFQGVPPEVARILASLVQQETRIGSARMAHSVVDSLEGAVPVLPNPARHAGFAVLQSADIPSVLVEMGFMSNPQDEAALRRPDHRRRVALAMQRAVDAYFAAGPITRVS